LKTILHKILMLYFIEALRTFFNTAKGVKTIEKFIAEPHSLVETYVGQFSKAYGAKNNLLKKYIDIFMFGTSSVKVSPYAYV
jgi:hypothetical protein